MAHYKRSLFIFRRDLRLADNTGLLNALLQSHEVIPCFIFDPRQISSHAYRSLPGLHFMLESLHDLQEQLAQHNGQLYCFAGQPEEVIDELLTKHHIDAVFVNKDYTPFSIKRDAAIAKICRMYAAAFNAFGDLLLHEPEQIAKKDGSPYTRFMPFFNLARQHYVAKPRRFTRAHFYTRRLGLKLAPLEKQIIQSNVTAPALNGGRTPGLKILKSIKKFARYESTRDYPALACTTLLSAHLKFGTVSIREVYHRIATQLGTAHPLLRQLYWRDFLTHIGYHFPHVFGKAFKSAYQDIAWENNRKHFNAWRTGCTGFPIIDAGMRQLRLSGFMHNRVRMLCASFLTKHLHIDWRWGEKHFARYLIDYDPCVNNGNWQWAASTGCDAQPYFRIFNPWLQQKKFDPHCEYIYRWLPELRQHSPATLHNQHYKQQKNRYPQPIVEHAYAALKAKQMFKRNRT